MKKLTVFLALLPALALAAPQPAPGRPPPASDDLSRMQRTQKRLRVARAVGLAEALDLDEAGGLRLRDAMARADDRRLPLQRQVRDATRVLRDAAAGDAQAAPGVDGALDRVRDARTRIQALDEDLLRQLTQGLTPEKKARAALFLARFRERSARMPAAHLANRRGPGPGSMRQGGPGPHLQRGAMNDAQRDDQEGGPGRVAFRGEGGAQPPSLESWLEDE